MNSIPVIRVNGDDPIAVMKAAKVAVNYRNKYNNDVVVDMMCYRRSGRMTPSFYCPCVVSVILIG